MLSTPPVTPEDAARLSEIGEAERRLPKRKIIEHAQRICAAYPANANRDVEVYIEELSMELSSFHPDVVEAVVFGQNRIQATSKFSPSVPELRAALVGAEARRFQHLRKARTALALYAATEIPGFDAWIRSDQDQFRRWQVAIEFSAGDEALEIVQRGAAAAGVLQIDGKG